MKLKESGKDKVKKICEVLRNETLEPARFEADAIIEEAKLQREQMLDEARRSIEKMSQEAKSEIQREKQVFHASLAQSCKQSIEFLKQTIQDKLFNKELGHLIAQGTRDPQVLAKLITAVIDALKKEGIDADLSAYIPSAVSAEAVNALLAQEVLQRLKEKSVLLSSIGGGIEVKLHKEHMTIDISDATLKELVAQYIRKDFREMFFNQ